ncbi:MAG: hypothetical protein ACKO0Z_16900 [Betaproteobacteria bacterium]
MEDVTDKLETLILLALDANHDQTDVARIETKGRRTDGHWEIRDQGQLLKFDVMKPKSAYTFDMVDKTRIFAATTDYLVRHPAETFGYEAETVVFGGGLLKWRGFRLLRKPPKGAACLGKASHWYEMHERLVSPDGRGEYVKRLAALDSKGRPLPTLMQGHIVCGPKDEGVVLVMCASLIEDAHRANTMLAEVKDATGIKFPVPIDDYKHVFAERDGQMNGARRKAIVHWVARHLRHSTRGKEFAVNKHTRGVQEFTIDGLRIRLTPNAEVRGEE